MRFLIKFRHDVCTFFYAVYFADELVEQRQVKIFLSQSAFFNMIPSPITKKLVKADLQSFHDLVAGNR